MASRQKAKRSVDCFIADNRAEAELQSAGHFPPEVCLSGAIQSSGGVQRLQKRAFLR